MIARRFLLWFLAMALSGCASYGVVRNDLLGAAPAEQAYSLKNWNTGTRVNDLNVTLAFSGGGTRAAAFSYGVLKALRDTVVTIDGRPVRLLDEIDTITSVSGGSFTAAYYGLYGERIFTDFEPDFLRRDVEQALLDSLFNPLNWFRSSGRTERAIEYYEEHLFHGATFADMRQENRPLVVINASDLGYGVRFSFLQEYFGLLCSDLSTFPVARAVAASSAVPVVFNPVVLANHPQCGSAPPGWLAEMRRRAEGDERKMMQVDGLATYFDRDKRQYAHLVDGGITDNLGLRAIVDLVEAVGGPEAYLKAVGRGAPQDQVLIVVNASTEPEPQMDGSNRQPSAGETIGALTDIQLHRYNIDTIELTRTRLHEWARSLSTPERPIHTYFVLLSFRDVPPERRRVFNTMPTSFALSDEQVGALISAGSDLLQGNAEFRRFLANVGR